MKQLLILATFLAFTVCMSFNVAHAYVILSEDKCDLFDCCSVLNIVNHTQQELNQLKNTARSDLKTHIGQIDFSTITIQNSTSIRICGNIAGASQNYWGISTFWNSTWWNSTYLFRYPFYEYRNGIAQPFSINDTGKVFGRDIIWTNISNNTLNYVYCRDSNCVNTGYDYRVAQETMEIYWENETNLKGNSSTNVWDSSYQLVLHMNNASLTDSTKYRIKPTTIAGFTASDDNIIFGRGLNFSGNDGAQYTGANVFNHTGAMTGWTVEMWAKSASLSGGIAEAYWFRCDSEELRMAIGEDITAGNQLFCGQFNGTWVRLTTSIANNVTYHVACRWNGTGLGLFVNGLQVASAPMPTFTASTDGCAIGSQMGGQEFRGWLDELRVSNVSRSDAYIWDSYQNGKGNYTYFGAEETPDDLNPPYYNNTESYANNITDCEKKWAESTINVSWYDPENNFNWCKIEHNLTGVNVNYTDLGDAYYPPKADYTFNVSLNCSDTKIINWRMFCNDTYGNWNNTEWNTLTVTSQCACPINATGIQNTYCNGTILQTDYLYNQYTGQWVNVSKNCTWGCDNELNLCKPNDTYSFLWIIGILLAILLIATFIKRYWA